MNSCERGSAALLRVLGARLHDIREETPMTFGRWLERHIRGWGVDPVFQQRVRIREIRRANPTLQALERRRHAARTAYEASPEYRELEQLRRELAGSENAVAGLEHALGRETAAEEMGRLREKLAFYDAMVARLDADLEHRRSSNREWQDLHDADTRLAEARVATGFSEEFSRLEELQRRQGRSSGRSGSAFELSAAVAIRAQLLPELEHDYGTADLVILQGVRLGSARAEFDHLVIRASDDHAEPVEVMAAVEAKRNPNDLAHGFRHRIDNLSWFVGLEGRYNADSYRTATFPEGHFDRAAVHVEKSGRRYVFTRESFAAFADDLPEREGEVHLPRRLYLISRPGWLWGIGSGGLGRLAHRVSSDVDFDLSDPAYLATLLEWSKRLTHVVETPDLFRRFALNEGDASRILLLSQES